MPAYYYEGAYANGERVTGVVEAPSRTEAVNQIRRNCDMVMTLREVKKKEEGGVTLFRRWIPNPWR